MRFYVKSGDQWQRAGERDGAHWSGYETLAGTRYRYAQARIRLKKFVKNGKKDNEGGDWIWVDGGLIDNIPTCIPSGELPDYRPVLEFSRWMREKARIRLRYVPLLEGFPSGEIVDIDPFLPGNQGEFGAVLVEPSGFSRHQRGIDIAGVAGETPVKAAAVGRVVVVSRKGRKKASAVDFRTDGVTHDFPRGRPDKGAVLREYGNSVYVMHPDGYTIRYGNLDGIEVEVGQGVLPGTKLGTVGVSPIVVSGETLQWVHIEVRRGNPLIEKDSVPVNPLEFFKSKAGDSADLG